MGRPATARADLAQRRPRRRTPGRGPPDPAPRLAAPPLGPGRAPPRRPRHRSRQGRRPPGTPPHPGPDPRPLGLPDRLRLGPAARPRRRGGPARRRRTARRGRPPPPPGRADTLAEAAARRLSDAVTALPLHRAGHPYNADALALAVPAPDGQDTPWHQVRLLLRLHRYAQEVVATDAAPDPRVTAARHALDHHRDASEAAHEAASAAATPRIAPTTAYALGVLHADQRHEVEAARYAFQRAWAGEAVGASATLEP